MNSDIWAGWAAKSTINSYTDVAATWTEPSVNGCSGGGGGVLFWVGLGGYTGNPLGQNGTSADSPGLGQHQAWYEIWPQLPNVIAVNLYASVGYKFEASTTWANSTNFIFWFYNHHTGATKSITTSSGGFNGMSAEAIAERPTVNNNPTKLSNFGTVTFSATANYANIANFTRDKITMKAANGDILATPRAIGSDGQTFNVAHNACS